MPDSLPFAAEFLNTCADEMAAGADYSDGSDWATNKAEEVEPILKKLPHNDD
jgi:hypothetical protein